METEYELKLRSVADYDQHNLQNLFLKISILTAAFVLVSANLDEFSSHFNKVRKIRAESWGLDQQVELADRLKTTEATILMVRKMYGDEEKWPPEAREKYFSLVTARDKYLTQYSRLRFEEDRGNLRYEENFVFQKSRRLGK